MKIEENKEILNRVIELAKNKATGKPFELAEKLGVSERTIYRIKNALKDQGIPIRYSKRLQSYIIE